MKDVLKDYVGSVSVVPMATVRSWRIAGLYYMLVLGAGTYILLELIFFHRYAEMTPSTSFVNLWHVSTRSSQRDHANYSYCNNATFDWPLTPEQMAIVGPFRLINTSCSYFTDAEVIVVGHNVIGISTSMFRVYPNGSTEFNFVTQLEDIAIKFQHTILMPDGTEIRNPPTEIVDSRGIVVVNEEATANQHITLTVNDILRIIGSQLDVPNPQLPNFPVIRYRSTGMMIAVRMKYFNVEPWVAGKRPRCRVSMKLTEGSWGNVGSLARNDLSLNRFGVQLIFLIEGEMAVTTPYRIVFHFISGFVLIELARNVVLIVIKIMKAMTNDTAFRDLKEVTIDARSKTPVELNTSARNTPVDDVTTISHAKKVETFNPINTTRNDNELLEVNDV